MGNAMGRKLILRRAVMLPVFAELATVPDGTLRPAGFCEMLDRHGFVDLTPEDGTHREPSRVGLTFDLHSLVHHSHFTFGLYLDCAKNCKAAER